MLVKPPAPPALRQQNQLMFTVGSASWKKRIMVDTGVRGLFGTRKRYVNREQLITTEDPINRNFTAIALHPLWCTDVTENPTREGKVYCCAVIDVYSRHMVGWAINTRQTTALALNALDMAVETRRPHQTVIRSDQGTQAI